LITVTRTGESNNTVTANYVTSSGSAQAGSDYIESSGMLLFASGETTKSFTVLIIDDGQVEGSETVNLQLTSVTGGASLGLDRAVLTIIDNDVAGKPVLQVDSSVDFGNV